MHKEGPKDVRRSERLQRHSETPPQATLGQITPSSNKRKRSRKTDATSQVPTNQPRKRRRSSPTQGILHQKDIGAGSGLGDNVHPSQRAYLSHWAEQQTWPEAYYQHEKNSMQHLLARQRSSPSLRRKRSDSSLVTTSTQSDQLPREEKSAPYRNKTYVILLETLGNSYMRDMEQGITQVSKELRNRLLASKHTTPKDTLFRDDIFPIACQNLQDKNEARVIQDIARLLVPSPESLAAFGAKQFNVLTESVNEGWNSCVPVTSTRPQPDFAVGFKRSIFSDEQLTKLQPILGDPLCLSYFKATYYMYFPFLTCEVKCGATALDIADRQNAHSMTIAVRGIVELFKLAKRDQELNGKLLTFSVTHDHRTVRLYGHYPVIDDSKKTKIYRHAIHTYDITVLDGKDKWTTYNFVMAVYNHSLGLLSDIRSIVDGLPDDFAAQLCAPESLHSESSEALQSPPVEEQVTPDTSTQTGTGTGTGMAAPPKKSKGKAG
ncbi:MAG: hypothetical protein Q9204_001619 [Flavoplaca sp. TL-2023a]